MQVIKSRDDSGLIVELKEGNDRLEIHFARNLDLYWVSNSISHEHTITKENYYLYNLFEQLYKDIETINLFNDETYPLEEDKVYFRKYDRSNYNELFNKKEKTITWYSDETNEKVANYLTIKKLKDSFKITFKTQEHIDGYDRDYHNKYSIPVRFRNSGSRYDPFNCIFMRMYQNMEWLDDVLDEGHQIHIDEYLYNQKRLVRRNTKK